MPAGLEFIRWLRRASPGTVPVVLTAYGTEAMRASSRDLGVAFFFAKPKRFDEIADAIAQIASRPRAMEARV